VITGSTRMKAGTATKLVLNTLTTATMIKLGKVYGNLMIDLNATNDKLKDRSLRILSKLTGLNRHDAEALLVDMTQKLYWFGPAASSNPPSLCTFENQT
jgi:N-acetylmuramic acid 6-phosphate etherase